MSPSRDKPEPPEKTGGRQPATKQTEASAGSRPASGLQLPALVTAPTWEVGLSALVQDFTPGEVVLQMDDEIQAGTRVTIQLNTTSFSGDILFCAPSGSHYEAHVSFDDVDASGLRRTPRFPVNIPARVFSGASDLPLQGKIVDVSGEGLGIDLATPLPKQSHVAVQSEESTALGVVRHCREISSGLFRAGVLFQHIVKKEPELENASAESGLINKLGVGRRKKTERPKGWS